MASSFSPTGTVAAGASSASSADEEPEEVALLVVVAGAAVVAVADEPAAMVVAGTRARSDTSASRSMKSSRNWMISTRSVSSSSSFVSSRPQPDAARARMTRAAGARVRMCMPAVFQRITANARRPGRHDRRSAPGPPTTGIRNPNAAAQATRIRRTWYPSAPSGAIAFGPGDWTRPSRSCALTRRTRTPGWASQVWSHWTQLSPG